MADEKLRLLLFEECDRDCPGCCNRDWDLRSLPVCRGFTPYQVIMLTGGEPMLHPEIIREAVAEIRAQTQAPIYLYTARTQGLDELMPILDGVTLTLHEPGDCLPFWRFDQSTQSLDGKSLRLNIFEEVGPVASSERWQVKDHMAWIPNCPLPQGEVLMRFRPYGG